MVLETAVILVFCEAFSFTVAPAALQEILVLDIQGRLGLQGHVCTRTDVDSMHIIFSWTRADRDVLR